MTDATVTGFEHANYQGRRLDLTTNQHTLSATWRNRISSIKTTTPVVLFSENGYKGDAVTLTDDTPSFASIAGKNFNDRTRSVLATPIKIKLNVIVGATNGNPARPFAAINQDVSEANKMFGPFGLRIDVDQVTVGDAQLHTPHTVETFETARAKYRSDSHLNVTYFDGPLYRPLSWRWRVSSVKVEPRTGTARQTATLFNRTSGAGTPLPVRGELASLPSGHNRNVRSLTMGRRARVTVFSRTNFRGESRTFHNDITDLGRYSSYLDWWDSVPARATGTTADWRQFDVALQPDSSTRLAWGVAQALNVNLGRGLTPESASAAIQHLRANAALAAAHEIG